MAVYRDGPLPERSLVRRRLTKALEELSRLARRRWRNQFVRRRNAAAATTNDHTLCQSRCIRWQVQKALNVILEVISLRQRLLRCRYSLRSVSVNVVAARGLLAGSWSVRRAGQSAMQRLSEAPGRGHRQFFVITQGPLANNISWCLQSREDYALRSPGSARVMATRFRVERRTKGKAEYRVQR